MKWFPSIALMLVAVAGYGQDSIPRNWALNGYCTNMQSFTFQRFNGNWTSDNLVHNRLNFKWYAPSNAFGVVTEVRNRFMTGESVETVPGYASRVDADNGRVDLSGNLSTGQSSLLNSKIDRLFTDFTNQRLQVRVGRQRINWGQCFTWNPNDLFNAYSFFDFDYVEKPGSDALRVQYFANTTSAVEVAVKADRHRQITSAALYRFNRWNYDIQVLGGVLNGRDYVAGTGWSGNVAKASLRGEVSYFHPRNRWADTSGVVVVALGSEYAFKNSLLLQCEVLYNQRKTTDVSGFADYYAMDLSAKNLSVTPFSLMLRGSYPVTPLFSASLAAIYFPKMNGTFVGPSLSYSLADNVDFSLVAQSFAGQLTKGKTEYFHLGFFRLKWCF